MIKAHKIRLNPTPEQEACFRKACGTARFVYNWALARWKEHKATHPGEDYGPMALKKEFNAIKRPPYPWVYDVTKRAAEGAFANLASAFKAYYDWQRGQRRGGRVGFPRFKSKKRSKRSFCLANDKFGLADHKIRIPKLGWVNMTEALRCEGRILSATVTQEAEWWYVAITVEVAEPEPEPEPVACPQASVGVTALAALSDGRQVENPQLLRSELNKLKRLNRELARRGAIAGSALGASWHASTARSPTAAPTCCTS